MRLIDADYLMCDIGCVNAVKYGNETPEEQHASYSTLMMYEIADYINDAETVDAVEVIRCKDCKMLGPYLRGGKYVYCDRTCMIVQEEDYCSYGERKVDVEAEDETATNKK